MEELKSVYLIGIGGIGMSALARYFNYRGVEVAGYDKTSTELTRQMEGEGISIHYQEDLGLCPKNPDLVIITPAVPSSHLELKYYQMAIPEKVMKRAKVLGVISRDKKTIAIGGTHGKTTTSTLLTHLLRSAGVEVTAFLGGIGKDFKSNFIYGNSDWMVVEADEFDRSFLHLSPDIAVILSTDSDHLDIYGNPQRMLEEGYLAFGERVASDGALWVHESYAAPFRALSILKEYGEHSAEARWEHLRVKEGQFVFNYISPLHQIYDMVTPLPGRHNVENAVVAISIALTLGVSPEALKMGLGSFQGIKRRFEVLYRSAQAVYVDDYAHHPTELNAAIAAARALWPDQHLTVIFQPHLYSRTRDFAEGFAEALSLPDRLILMPIYPARELPIPGIHSESLLEQIVHEDKRILEPDEVLEWLKEYHNEGVIMTLGAGNIDLLRNPILDWIQNR
jgi:UDP-N-acetylmuramate--alanine ligase